MKKEIKEKKKKTIENFLLIKANEIFLLDD
jgi:hypothetical protein